MPRLRIRKDWSYEENLSDTGTQSDAESAAVTGQSYLSNAAVVASLPDARLLAAVEYYKSTLAVLEAEVRVRSLTGRSDVPIAWPSMFGPAVEDRATRRERRSKSSSRLRTPKKAVKGQVTLSAGEMLKALEMLLQLKGVK